MKLTATIAVIILAATVSASAVPSPDARCGYVGQPCGKVRRAAEAFAEALAEPVPAADHDAALAARCDMGSCYEAKMMTRDLAAIVAETTEDPAAYFAGLGLEDEETSQKLKRDASARCGYVGQPCGKVKREAAPEARCGYVGQPCGKAKREADPEADAWCGYVGQPCGKLRRAAEALAEAVAVSEAEPAPQCGYVGQPCGKAKRDALALAHAADLVLGNL